MQVLPDRSPNGAGNPHVVVQTAQVAGHRELDQVVVNLDPASGPHPRVVQELDFVYLVADHQPPKALVPYQNVGTEAQQEVRHLQLTGDQHRVGELIRCAGAKKQVRGPTDLEGG